jgi:short-subunit dehydrogenase involved in D-alanine esterification of teichoic acids
VSLREVLKGKVEVIELVPPAVQTDLTPGQATRQGYLPLAEFIEEVMALFQSLFDLGLSWRVDLLGRISRCGPR